MFMFGQQRGRSGLSVRHRGPQRPCPSFRAS